MAFMALQFSNSAALKIHELIQEAGNPDLKLRVRVVSGGCAGFQYDFAFDDTVQETDTVIKQPVLLKSDEKAVQDADCQQNAEVQLLVDEMSHAYLSEANIDYEEDLSGAHFVVRNRNAENTCSCGTSFSGCSKSEQNIDDNQ